MRNQTKYRKILSGSLLMGLLALSANAFAADWLALQARKLGLYAHAMAGFNREKAYEILKVHAKEYDIMAAIAVGYRAEPGSLPELVAAAEKPSDRKIREEVARQGAF